MKHAQAAHDGNKTAPPPTVGTTPPRNDFGPRDEDFGSREVLTILGVLARRQHARAARLSSLSRLRGDA